MVNTSMFNTMRGPLIPEASIKNEAGGAAYALSPEHALAQYAITGCLTNTFYATAETQLKTVIELCDKVSPEFIARLAIYCRHKGYMKDMPALLCAYLTVQRPHMQNPGRGIDYFPYVFRSVIDNGKMLRNFCQIIRSGVLGRKSFGSRPKREIARWLNTVSWKKLIEAYVGNTPSLGDIIKMVHPKSENLQRNAFFAWCIGKPYVYELLPVEIMHYEAWKKGELYYPTMDIYLTDELDRWKQDTQGSVPPVPFQMLTAQPLTNTQWRDIALDANWHTIRMNLNTFKRHGVYDDEMAVKYLARALKDADTIKKVRVFPYQLYTTYLNIENGMPHDIKEALQDALDVTIDNVPAFNGKIAILLDVSSSMTTPITGYRSSVTSKVMCSDVATLLATSFLRKNKDAIIIPFDTRAFRIDLNPRDTVITNAQKLRFQGGGTDCSVAFKGLMSLKKRVDLIIMISDNQSWIETNMNNGILQVGKGTASMVEFTRYCTTYNPKCKLVNIDLHPYVTTQTNESKNIMNIGGWSDHLFEVIKLFEEDKLGPQHWVDEIKKVELI